MISCTEGKELILAHSIRFKKRLFKISINKASGFVLAENIKAKCFSPPFNQSAMDGFAFQFKDLKSGIAIAHNPVLENSAGNSKISKIPNGQSIRIFTGAKMPINSDLVIPQENIQLNNNTLEFDSKIFKQFDNVRLKGSQFKKGDLIIKKGEVLNAPRIALAANAGHANVNVFALPKVSIIVSGNELIAPGKTLTGDKIYESNSVMLDALLKENKINTTNIQFVKDNISSTTKAIKKALKESDIVLISGGISVGKYDLIKDVLGKLKTETIFYKIKQKPGKPLYFGKNNNRYVFGLPGNPAASLTCFFEYVQPFLKSASGQNNPFCSVKKAVLNNSYVKKPGLTHFLKGFVSDDKVTILPDQESYKLTSFSEANCLIIIPEETTEITEGQLVEYHLI